MQRRLAGASQHRHGSATASSAVIGWLTVVSHCGAHPQGSSSGIGDVLSVGLLLDRA
jgi:hypothetical protein